MNLNQAASLGEATAGLAACLALCVGVYRSTESIVRSIRNKFRQKDKLDLILRKLTPDNGSSVIDKVIQTHEEVVGLRLDVQTEWASSAAVHADLQRQLNDVKHEITEIEKKIAAIEAWEHEREA